MKAERTHCTKVWPLFCHPLTSLLSTISVHRPVNDTEEKAVTRLALTYGVLRRLGFSEERVMECLSAISGYDLDEAYDWVRAAHFSMEEVLTCIL